MRVDLLKGKFYKANLHSHSTLSDGRLTPEEAKEAYKSAGYSIYSYTEHGEYHDLRRLDDPDFITLPAYELDYYKYENPPVAYTVDGKEYHTHCNIHLNCFALDPDTCQGEVEVFDLNGSAPNARRTWEAFSMDDVNEGIRRLKAAGFFVVYNHPHWSNNSWEFYSKLEGLDGIELMNGASHRSSGMDFVPQVYRELGWLGKRMICVGGDDNHATHHQFWAWTMIGAQELTHRSVMKALQEGNCYTSAGPEIFELYVEDGEVYVRCSEAQAIYFSTSAGYLKGVRRMEQNNDQPVTEAHFSLRGDEYFFQILVEDMRGRYAATRLYYMDEHNFNIPEGRIK
ncbi:MAG: CehA/McbA family metallohydrolase [Clostridia bacterium]|nr:CehA/McbA family metallohydrolase [Clostridia bacterium]